MTDYLRSTTWRQHNDIEDAESLSVMLDAYKEGMPQTGGGVSLMTKGLRPKEEEEEEEEEIHPGETRAMTSPVRGLDLAMYRAVFSPGSTRWLIEPTAQTSHIMPNTEQVDSPPDDYLHYLHMNNRRRRDGKTRQLVDGSKVLQSMHPEANVKFHSTSKDTTMLVKKELGESMEEDTPHTLDSSSTTEAANQVIKLISQTSSPPPPPKKGLTLDEIQQWNEMFHADHDNLLTKKRFLEQLEKMGKHPTQDMNVDEEADDADDEKEKEKEPSPPQATPNNKGSTWGSQMEQYVDHRLRGPWPPSSRYSVTKRNMAIETHRVIFREDAYDEELQKVMAKRDPHTTLWSPPLLFDESDDADFHDNRKNNGGNTSHYYTTPLGTKHERCGLMAGLACFSVEHDPSRSQMIKTVYEEDDHHKESLKMFITREQRAPHHSSTVSWSLSDPHISEIMSALFSTEHFVPSTNTFVTSNEFSEALHLAHLAVQFHITFPGAVDVNAPCHTYIHSPHSELLQQDVNLLHLVCFGYYKDQGTAQLDLVLNCRDWRKTLDLNRKSGTGETPLSYAIRSPNDANLLTTLLHFNKCDRGRAVIHTQDLQLAVTVGGFAKMNTLLDHGASVHHPCPILRDGGTVPFAYWMLIHFLTDDEIMSHPSRGWTLFSVMLEYARKQNWELDPDQEYPMSAFDTSTQVSIMNTLIYQSIAPPGSPPSTIPQNSTSLMLDTKFNLQLLAETVDKRMIYANTHAAVGEWKSISRGSHFFESNVKSYKSKRLAVIAMGKKKK